MKTALYALWTAMELGYGWLFFAAFYGNRRRREETQWFLLLFWLLLTACRALCVDAVSPLLLRLLALVVMLLYLFGESGQRGLLLLAFAFALSLIIEVAALYLTGAFTGASPTDAGYAAAITAGKAMSILSAFLLGRFKKEDIRRKSSKWLYLTILLPTLLTFCVAAAFVSRSAPPTGAILVCGVLLLANLAIHYAIRTMEKSAARELDMMLQRQHLEMQTESINALEQNYRLQRKSTHEFEHHLQVLQDLLDAGEAAEAKEYIRCLRGSRSYRVISVNSRHTVIDVILNQKYQVAGENGIIMQIQVNDLSRVTLPTDSLVVILSNLLDNAIEACRRLEGYREISCSVLYEGELYIAIQNTSEPVQIRDGRISTSKPDKAEHGFGLSSVCCLLDKLGAEYTFDWADGWFRFAAEIPDEPNIP